MDGPHRRFNPLLDEWVLVSPHRTQRPWLGATEAPAEPPELSYDPTCYLCPGNLRAGGQLNPDYAQTYAFPNDFPALLPDASNASGGDLMRAEPAAGECRVLCYSPHHNRTLAAMSADEVESVVRLWQDETAELGQRYAWVQIFENHGEAMGASNPHPHGQVWATSYLPTVPHREDEAQKRHHDLHHRPLLIDYLAAERATSDRIVLETDTWAWLVPFWAVWPYETLLLPKRHVSSLLELEGTEVRDLATILGRLLRTYNRLFAIDFPYSMGWHGWPRRGTNPWHLHAHFFPPLLRSATVRKHMVGFEMLGEAQRDITPEAAASRLRDLVD